MPEEGHPPGLARGRAGRAAADRAAGRGPGADRPDRRLGRVLGEPRLQAARRREAAAAATRLARSERDALRAPSARRGPRRRLRIEVSGWKGREGTAIADRPREERFQRLLARWADSRGWLRLWFLRLDDRPIAFRLGIEARGVFTSLKIGYLEEYAAQSPGKVLEAAVIESLHRGDCRRFDYAGGTTAHKDRFATGSCPLLELSAFPDSLRGRAGRVAAC